MKLIDVSDQLPSIGEKRKEINRKKLIKLAEEVRKILIEERKLEKREYEDISSTRHAWCY